MEVRKAYFDNKRLSITEGYKVFMTVVRLITSYISVKLSSEYFSLGP